MRKRILILILLLVFLFSFPVMAEENGDFRNAKWGMDRKEVKKAIDIKIYEENNKFVMYKTTVANLDSVMLFQFAKNNLVSAGYYFNETHTNKNLYLDDYRNIQDILTNKYGDPTKNEVYWSNDLYKGDEENYGTAIAVGHLTLESEWETEETLIRLRLYGDNFQIDHVVLYESKDLKYLKEAAEEKENEEDF